jgi:hypothetical protein
MMTDTAQARAVRNYRNRLKKRGVSRFEVFGLDSDRELIRALARKLALDDPAADHIRAEVIRSVSNEQTRGGILAALRRSPLVGEDLNIVRPRDAGRKVDL